MPRYQKLLCSICMKLTVPIWTVDPPSSDGAFLKISPHFHPFCNMRHAIESQRLQRPVIQIPPPFAQYPFTSSRAAWWGAGGKGCPLRRTLPAVPASRFTVAPPRATAIRRMLSQSEKCLQRAAAKEVIRICGLTAEEALAVRCAAGATHAVLCTQHVAVPDEDRVFPLVAPKGI